MASHERPPWDAIRDLLEESDRIRKESERTRNHADRAMKQPFWPERRRAPRMPWAEEPHRDDEKSGSAQAI